MYAIRSYYGEGNDLVNLGIVYKELGQVRKAIQYYENGLIINEKIGHQYGEGICLNNLGNAYKKLGQKDKAAQYFQQALAIFEEIKSPYAEITRKNLADLNRITSYNVCYTKLLRRREWNHSREY